MASYKEELKALAESIGSDGCTGVADICIECCWEHDWTYVTGMTPRGVVVTKEYADRRFRDCIQARMRLRWYSPFSWIRYIGVKKLGKGVWSKPVVKVQSLYFDEEARQIHLANARSAQLRIYYDLAYTYGK